MTPLLRLAHVSKRFAPHVGITDRVAAWLGAPVETRTVHAVDDVSLTIGKGEVLGLVGESGCGKSTLARIIAGIHAPSSGEALYDGMAIMSSARQPVKTLTKIQMIFQDPFASLDPRLRIGDTIAEGPLAHRLVTRAGAPDYVRDWLAAVGLPAESAERFPHQFSGGQRQRVAIARALAMKPDLLVCDEPIASLDVSIQAQIVNLFLKLKRELSVAMLFISHDLAVVRHISDRVAIMYLGRIVESGPTPEIYRSPRHPYTKALLDSVPKLTVDGTDVVSFKPIEGELPSPLNPPSGCHFHLRCSFVQPRCKVDAPRLDHASEAVACHYPL